MAFLCASGNFWCNRLSDKQFSCVIGREWPKKVYSLPAGMRNEFSESLYFNVLPVTAARHPSALRRQTERSAQRAWRGWSVVAMFDIFVGLWVRWNWRYVVAEIITICLSSFLNFRKFVHRFVPKKPYAHIICFKTATCILALVQ